MNFQNMLKQFTGTASNAVSSAKSSGLGTGLMGGAAAGGVMALLAGNKSARKFAGKAATVGGAALIGGIAFKAYKNWQQNNQSSSQEHNHSQPTHYSGDQGITADISAEFQLTLIKAMIGAAKADGHIDETEQKRIFDAVEQMSLSAEMKGLVFDLLRQPIYVQELAHGAQNMEQKSEIYLASCLAIDLDNPAEYSYLDKLAGALNLPGDLAQQIRTQAKEALSSDRVLN
jgi:uncharacterized membrane protein YebE (DUF533 family)